jgi:hypothetical protein
MRLAEERRSQTASIAISLGTSPMCDTGMWRVPQPKRMIAPSLKAKVTLTVSLGAYLFTYSAIISAIISFAALWKTVQTSLSNSHRVVAAPRDDPTVIQRFLSALWTDSSISTRYSPVADGLRISILAVYLEIPSVGFSVSCVCTWNGSPHCARIGA